MTVAATAVSACGGSSKNARRPGDEYLKKIDVQGNQQVKERHLTSGLALQRTKKRQRPPDPYLIQLDEDRIRGEYLRRGFFGIDVRSRVDRAGDAATVIYTVEEGKRAATRVVITGIPSDPDLPLDKIRQELPLQDGAPFDYLVYDLAKPRLLGVVQDAGYAHAQLDSTVYADRANRLAIVQLDYDLGPKCKFGDVEISGVTGDLADAVRGRLQFKPGETYSTQAIANTQRQLYGMGRFSTVQVQPAETDGPVVGVKVAVSEAARREVRLGGGFGLDPTAYEARARAGYTIAGWPFPLDTVTIDLRPAYAYMRHGGGFQPRIRALARLERQDLLWTYGKGEVEGGYSYVALEPYTYYGPRARLGFQTPVVSSRLQAGIGWQLEQLDFRNVSPLIEPLAEEIHIDRTQRVGAFTQALTLDLRDHPVEPRLGAYAALRSAIGTKYAGGRFEYLQLIPEVRGYVPIGPVVIGARARVGTFRGDVPATERFFSGGGSNHRGFGERKLAPSVTGDVGGTTRSIPYGGAALVETGLETRFPITEWRKIGIGGAVFLDGGDVTEELSQINLSPGGLHWAAGVGLRLHTLVGPVRADLGYRLNRTGPMEPAPGSRFAFHLSLGEAF
ncbi:MAG TPA: BamA/TamA family outer membrane protein [Kofleriaceae bacterium]|nr:BamA/TamA family outer membrane protein [Kofleriaceae bacterium]